MSRISKYSLILLAAALISLPACSDDDTAGTDDPDSGTTADATDAPETPSDAGPDDADTSGEADADTGSSTDATDTTDPSDATDTDNGDTSTVDAGDATDTADTGPLDPDAGHSGCTFPADQDAGCPAEAYGDYGPASFLNEFVVKQGGECCTDFTSDGRVDSALGDLAAAIQGILGVPFNDVIAAQIQNGVLVYLFQYSYWSDANNDPALDFDMVFGRDTDADFTDNLAGTGDFLIDPTSLDANGDPKSDFPTASTSIGTLTVSGGTAPLVLPVGTDLVEVVVNEVGIEADVVAGADLQAGGRVSLTNGELSGYISLTELYGSLNTIARSCSCISTDPVFEEASPDSWVCNSTQADQTACENDPNASTMCVTLATPSGPQSCGSIRTFVGLYADVDTDSDGNPEALSLGAEFEAVGAKVTGVAP